MRVIAEGPILFDHLVWSWKSSPPVQKLVTGEENYNVTSLAQQLRSISW